MILQGFVGPSYVSRFPTVAVERCVNWYASPVEVPGEKKAGVVLMPTPGVGGGSGPGAYTGAGSTVFQMVQAYRGTRAMREVGGRAFLVQGQYFIEMVRPGEAIGPFLDPVDRVAYSAGGVRNILPSNKQPAQIIPNGVGQLLIVSGGKPCIFDTNTNTFPPTVAFPATPNNQSGGVFFDTSIDFVMGGYSDGYFWLLDASTGTMYLSDFENGLLWTGGSAQRSTGADRWQTMIGNRGEILSMGARTSDVLRDTGALFPFEPIDGAFVDVGIEDAPWSAHAVDGKVIWISRTEQGRCMVHMASGYQQPVRISTHALEFAMSNMLGIFGSGTITDARAWSYQMEGHTFYVLVFPTGDQTWVYDLSTGWWHERGEWDFGANAYRAIRATCHMEAWGIHWIGEREGQLANGDQYGWGIESLLPDSGGDSDILINGELRTPSMRRQRRFPHLTNEGERLVHSELRIEFQAGIGGPSETGFIDGVWVESGFNPQATLTYSNDGGRTWSNALAVSLGLQGHYSDRAIWRRLGQARDRVYDVVYSDYQMTPMVAAYLKVGK